MAFPTLLTEVDASLICRWSQALITPVIAGIGVTLTWRQWRTNHDRLRYDLFDRRYAIYKAAGRLISVMMDGGAPSKSAMCEFREHTQGCRLLFGKEVDDHLSLLWADAIQLRVNNSVAADCVQRSDLEIMKDLKCKFENLTRSARPTLHYRR